MPHRRLNAARKYEGVLRVFSLAGMPSLKPRKVDTQHVYMCVCVCVCVFLPSFLATAVPRIKARRVLRFAACSGTTVCSVFFCPSEPTG